MATKASAQTPGQLERTSGGTKYSNDPIPAKHAKTVHSGKLRGNTEDEDLKMRANISSPQGTNFLKMPRISEKEIVKEAEHTLLDGKYPVDTYDQVAKALEYFNSYKNDFTPEDRHEYCVKLAHRMDQLGMNIPSTIERYGSTEYAPDVDAYLETRRQYINPEFEPALDTLIEKRAHVTPELFAETLKDFDELAMINFLWGSDIPDPYYSTFGPSMSKVAEKAWEFHDGDIRITEEDLKGLALNHRCRVKKQFGSDFADSFSKNPKTIFNSLPKPNKLVIARMAMEKY